MAASESPASGSTAGASTAASAASTSSAHIGLPFEHRKRALAQAQATPDEDVLWSENAWDHASWGPEQDACVCAVRRTASSLCRLAEAAIAKQRTMPVSNDASSTLLAWAGG